MPAEANAAKAIFLAALDRDTPAARTAYLDEACAGNEALRRRVEAMLRAHDQPDPLLDRPAVAYLPGTGDKISLDFLAPATGPDAIGRLGHYEILNVVGRGGTGVVLRGFDEKRPRGVAVKVLDPVLAGNEAARVRFVREARAAAAVSHDRVIGIYEVEGGGPVPYLVMQYVEGKTLQQKLDRTGALPLKEVLRIGLQIAEGLAAAHQQGLVHRDVKPSNILLENGVERVKLGDFGLARTADDPRVTRSGVVAGTPAYMSPEQAAGEPLDHRSDLFSLGSVLYAMCAGHPPFRGETTVAVIRQVCDGEPRPLRVVNPAVPEWLAALVAKLQAKKPADRYATAAEVAAVLGRRLAELQSGTEPRPDPAPARRGRVLLGGAALVALLAVTAGTAWVVATSRNAGRDAASGDPPAPPPVTPPAPAVPPAPVTLAPGRTLKEHETGVRTLAFSLDGKYLASGGFDHFIYLWDTAAWNPRGPLKGHAGTVSSLVFSPTSTRLASVGSGEEACRVRLWEVTAPEVPKDLGPRGSGMWDVAYSADGRTLACGGSDRTVYLLDAESGDERRAIPDAASHFVRALSLSADGRFVAAGGSGPTKVWDLTADPPAVTAAKLPDGLCPTFLPGGGLASWNFGEGKVYLCDLPSGQVRASWKAHNPRINGLAVSKDGRHVASVGEDRVCRVWSVADQSLVATLDGHRQAVLAVAFSPDGTRLATGGDEPQCVHIWDLPPVCHTRK